MEVKEIMIKFEKITVKHIPREQNMRVDVLLNIASMRDKGGNKFIIQEFIHFPSISESVMTTELMGPPSLA